MHEIMRGINMRDIGILTFHDTNNFGAILQAYATYQVIKNMGYDVEIIDYKCREIAKREVPAEIFREEKGIRSRLRWVKSGRLEQKKYEELKAFLRNNTVISKRVYYSGNAKDMSKEYRTVLVGSDMVWCTLYTHSDYTYMLEGVSGCRKITYATSGGLMWGKEEHEYIVSLLQDFNSIAMREISASEGLSEILGKKVWNVCDPTMLITQSKWKKMISEVEKKEDKFLVYMDDEEKNCRTNAERFAKEKKKIEIVGFRSISNMKYRVREIYSIKDFLKEIYTASVLFTASYHGLLFALYFHTPFVYYNKDSSRMRTLADKVGIGYRDGN